MANKKNEEMNQEEEIFDNEDELELDNEELEEELEPTSGLENNSRANIMSVMMHKMSEMDQNSLLDFYEKVMAGIGHEADAIPANAASKNQASIAMKKAIKEELETVFGDNQQLSEEFKEKVSTLFEAAVSSRLSILEAELQEAYEEILESDLEEITNNLVDKLDGYLDYIADTWVNENHVGIEKSLQHEISEEFIHDLKRLFEHHNIAIPEEKVDVLEMLNDRVEELEEQLNNVVSSNIELSESLKETEKQLIINELASDLSASQTEKFYSLVEDLDYNENFAEKAELIKETHFSSRRTPSSHSSKIITEEVVYSSDDEPEKRTALIYDPKIHNLAQKIG